MLLISLDHNYETNTGIHASRGSDDGVGIDVLRSSLSLLFLCLIPKHLMSLPRSNVQDAGFRNTKYPTSFALYSSSHWNPHKIRTKGCQILLSGIIVMPLWIVVNQRTMFNIILLYLLIPSEEFHYVAVFLVLALLLHIFADTAEIKPGNSKLWTFSIKGMWIYSLTWKHH